MLSPGKALAILAISSMMFLAAYSQGEQQPGQSKTEAEVGTEKSRNSFERELQGDIESIENRLTALEARAKAEGIDAKAAINNDISAMRSAIAEARSQMDRLQKAGEDEWPGIKASLDASLDRLKASIRDVDRDLRGRQFKKSMNEKGSDKAPLLIFLTICAAISKKGTTR